jgi:hypothetical protein
MFISFFFLLLFFFSVPATRATGLPRGHWWVVIAASGRE